MKLEADSILTFPREVVFTTYRDRLPELVPHLPNVKAIIVQKREDAPGGAQGVTKMLNLWQAKGEIPKAAQTFLKPEMLEWIDHATWNQNDWTVEWRVETKVWTTNIKCGGKNNYVALPNGGTRLEIRGDLDVDLKGILPGPAFIANKIAPIVEKFVVELLKPNLVSVATGLEAFLKSEAGAKKA